MTENTRRCPDCESPNNFNRRDFLLTTGAAVVAAGAMPGLDLLAAESKKGTPETLVKSLYESLKPEQRKEVCFDWDHVEGKLGVLRTRISNNWHITKPIINSSFFSADQQRLVRDIWEGIIQPEWHARVDKQLKDDAQGWGNQQN